MRADFMFTSESVTEGHPDKLCDQISDAIVDHFLEQDPYARVIAECAVATGVIFIATHYASTAVVDLPEVARRVIRQAGYLTGEFNADECTILTNVRELPRLEAEVVDERAMTDEALYALVSRDQVTVFGFACDQSAALMPLPIYFAHRLAQRLAHVRQRRELAYLSPDGKTQVGIEYHNRRPTRIHSITVTAAQLSADTPRAATLRDDLMEQVIWPAFEDQPLRPDNKTHIFVNPGGVLVGGGPAVHAGLTGRKTAIDSYGEYCRHSGAALSGKDPGRIDRIGAYAARYAAKQVVAAGLAQECEVQLSYAIGQAAPISVQVETFGTGRMDDAQIAEKLLAQIDFRVGGIIGHFGLRQLPAKIPNVYRQLAAYGHVGRLDLNLPWECTDNVIRMPA